MWEQHTHKRATYTDLADQYKYSVPWIQHLLDDFQERKLRGKKSTIAIRYTNTTISTTIPAQ